MGACVGRASGTSSASAWSPVDLARHCFRARWKQHGGRCCVARGRCCMGRGRCCMARGRCCMGRGRRDGRLRRRRLRRGCRCRVGHRNHHDGSGDDPRGRLRGNMRRGSRRRRSGSRGRTSRGRRRHWGRGRRSSRGRHWDLGRRRLVVVDHGWQPQWRTPPSAAVDDGAPGRRRPRARRPLRDAPSTRARASERPRRRGQAPPAPPGHPSSSACSASDARAPRLKSYLAKLV